MVNGDSGTEIVGPHSALSGGRKRRRNARTPEERCVTERDLLVMLLWREQATPAELKKLQTIETRFGSIGAALAAPFGELSSIALIGREGAKRMTVVRKLMREAAFVVAQERPITSNFDEFIVFLQWSIGRSLTRDIHLIYVNASMHMTHSECIASDVPNIDCVLVRQLITATLDAKAHFVVLAWNTLGDEVEPNAREIDFARDFRDACDLHNIVMSDFIIVNKGRFYSGGQAGCL